MNLPFDYQLDFSRIDFRRHPEWYRIGKGEQGVLLVEPYKSEILPHWTFKTVAAARKSSAAIYRLFVEYLQAGDFPGADMARKFLQMGWTRARRYANHPTGRKYDAVTGDILPRGADVEKAASAKIFYRRYVAARMHPRYLEMKTEHRRQIETHEPTSAKTTVNRPGAAPMAKKKKKSLVANINKRKQAGTSRKKSKSTISKEAYKDMQQGWPKRKKTKKKKAD